MPQDRSTKIETGESSPATGTKIPNSPEVPPHARPLPLWSSVLILIAVCAAIASGFVYFRRRAYRAWQQLAKELDGEFSPKNEISPRLVTGKLADRPYLLETAISHEDDAGYYHTRSAVPLKNAGSFVLGIRRKSLLEEVQTRSEKSQSEMNLPDFENRFFLYCNDPENLSNLLTGEVRTEILRYHDLEIYVRLGEIEWRRAGEQSDLRTIRRLNEMMLNMASAIDGFPVRGRSLTQCLADEKMIEKGV